MAFGPSASRTVFSVTMSKLDKAITGYRSWRRLSKKVGQQRRCSIAWDAIEADPLSDAHHRQGKPRVLGDVDWCTSHEPAFHIFG